MEIARRRNSSDIFGILASGLCAIHCTLTPLLFSIRPFMEGTLASYANVGYCWAALDYIFLTVSLIAVLYSTVYTNHKIVRRLLWGAWVVFALGLLTEPFHLPQSKWLMYAGSLGLICAHLYNHRYCRKCTPSHES